MYIVLFLTILLVGGVNILINEYLYSYERDNFSSNKKKTLKIKMLEIFSVVATSLIIVGLLVTMIGILFF